MENNQRGQIWFAVVNAYAASMTALSYWEKAENMFRQKGLLFHGTRTGKGGNVAELTFDACMAGYRKFIAVGGDGTVHDVLNGIAGFLEWGAASGRKLSFSDFTLAVIPVGSGNDWIKTYGMSPALEAAVDTLVAGVSRPQDVVRVSMLDSFALPAKIELSVSYMVNVAGIGLDADVCAKVNAKKKQGKKGKLLYVTSLVKSIMERQATSIRIICDDNTVFDGPIFSAAFGVGKYSGGGMRQTPAAVPDDGLLDLTVIPEIPMRRISKEAYRLFTGSLLEVPEVVSARARSIVIQSSDDRQQLPVQVDGEVVGKLPVMMQVLDSQINVVVPEK